MYSRLAEEFMEAVLTAKPKMTDLAKKLKSDQWSKDMVTNRCIELFCAAETDDHIMNILDAANQNRSYVIFRCDPLVEAAASSLVSDRPYILAKSKNLRTYQGLVRDTLLRFSDERVLEAIKRYDKIFEPKAELIEALMNSEECKDRIFNNNSLRVYYGRLVKRLKAPEAEPPNYLKKCHNYEDSVRRLNVSEVVEFDLEKSTILTRSELAQKFVASSVDQKISENIDDPDVVRKIVEIEFDVLEPLECYKIAEPWLLPGVEKPDSSEEIFKHLGPVSGFATEVDAENELIQDCFVYGHRMLKCNCTLLRSDLMNFGYTQSEYNWFDGECDKCCSTIKSMHHAVRLPEMVGMERMERWFGCYCSIKCAKEAANEMYQEDDYIQGIYNTIVDDIFYELNSKGIYDKN